MVKFFARHRIRKHIVKFGLTEWHFSAALILLDIRGNSAAYYFLKRCATLRSKPHTQEAS